MRRGALALLVVLALAAPAAAHGGTVRVTKAMGPYSVTFYGYDYVTEREDIQASFEILEAEGGAPVDAGNAVVVVAEVDAQGRVVNATERYPAQTERGFVVLELRSGLQGLLRYDLRLGGHNATFEQAVCGVDARGQLVCGLAAPAPSATPLPAAVALLALGFAAARRRAR